MYEIKISNNWFVMGPWNQSMFVLLLDVLTPLSFPPFLFSLFPTPRVYISPFFFYSISIFFYQILNQLGPLPHWTMLLRVNPQSTSMVQLALAKSFNSNLDKVYEIQRQTWMYFSVIILIKNITAIKKNSFFFLTKL